MFKRADGASELSGKKFDDGHMLHAMHLDHDKNSPDYNNPEIGLLVTVKEHLDYHMQHIGRAAEIGLTESQNHGAISLLLETDEMTIEFREREELGKNVKAALLAKRPNRV